jgi:enoyl-[acyl-carrier protein] reductase II
VQIGSRFAASDESSAHINFKKSIIHAAEGDTKLSLKKLTPVRLLSNAFSNKVAEAESSGADKEELFKLLGRGRAKSGMFEGNIEEGELEIGQISAMIDSIKPAEDILNEIWHEFLNEKERICKINFKA